jgi:hypothetical protein
MSKEEIARYLETAAQLQHAFTDNPAAEVAGKILHFAALALSLGKDPISHLSRLADIDPQFDAISKAADAAAHAKFSGEEPK